MERLCYDIISEIALLAAAGCHSRGAWRVVGRHADRRAASPSPPVVCGVHPGGAASSRPNSVDAQSSRDFGRLFQLNSGHDVSSCRFGWLRRTGSLDRCPARRLRRAARRFGRKSAFAERMPSALECPARSNAQCARMPNALESAPHPRVYVPPTTRMREHLPSPGVTALLSIPADGGSARRSAVSERYVNCEKSPCVCHIDGSARHGPEVSRSRVVDGISGRGREDALDLRRCRHGHVKTPNPHSGRSAARIPTGWASPCRPEWW